MIKQCCDRCGTDENVRITFRNEAKFIIQKFDLCRECYDDFKKFMKEKTPSCDKCELGDSPACTDEGEVCENFEPIREVNVDD